MFCMTDEFITVLQSFLKNFADEGLTNTVGGNMSEASAQVKAVSKRLQEANQLPLKAPTYILQGLTKCSVPKFTGPVKMMLNQERVTHMVTAVSLINNSSSTLKRVLHIIVLANNSYHSLNTSNVWNVPQGKREHHQSQNPHHTP